MAWQDDHAALIRHLEPEYTSITGGGSGQTVVLHMTAVQNLQSIVASAAIHCDQAVQAAGTLRVEIGGHGFKSTRRDRPVSAGRGGTTDQYVPFYFAPKSPMLWMISEGLVPTYTLGQEPILYLATTIERVHALGLPIAFSDGNCTSTYTRTYDDYAHLDKVDWSVMPGKYWNDTPEDPDRKRRRQAEFLVHDQLPFVAVQHVVAKTRRAAQAASTILATGSHQPTISINPNWYY